MSIGGVPAQVGEHVGDVDGCHAHDAARDRTRSTPLSIAIAQTALRPASLYGRCPSPGHRGEGETFRHQGSVAKNLSRLRPERCSIEVRGRAGARRRHTAPARPVARNKSALFWAASTSARSGRAGCRGGWRRSRRNSTQTNLDLPRISGACSPVHRGPVVEPRAPSPHSQRVIRKETAAANRGRENHPFRPPLFGRATDPAGLAEKSGCRRAATRCRSEGGITRRQPGRLDIAAEQLVQVEALATPEDNPDAGLEM